MHNTNADRDLKAIKDQLSEVIALLRVIAEQAAPHTTQTTRKKTR